MIHLLELTTDVAKETTVTELAQQARSYTTAAVCVPAAITARAAAELEGTQTKVAATISEDDPQWVARQAEAATDEGADEVDLVIPADTDLDELLDAVLPEVQLLKVHVDGEVAALAALQAGADFIAMDHAQARAALNAVAAHGSGGVKLTGLKDIVHAHTAIEAAAEILGAAWATPDTFRLGARAVLA